MQNRRSLYVVWFCLAALWVPVALAQSAVPNCSPAPQLQPGKTRLLDRVLVRPGATISPKTDGSGAKPVPAFSALFVYGHSPDGALIQVGASSSCQPQGWMQAESLVPWRHTMVAAFT